MSDEVIPGIVIATDERRIEDAAALAEVLLEDQSAVSAIVKMAEFAGLLHRSPGTPLTTHASLRATVDSGMELTADHLTRGVVMEELLDVIETWGDDGPSPEGLEILQRFNSRPGSSEAMEAVCSMVVLLMSAMKSQMLRVVQDRRSPDATARFAIAFARAVARQEPEPDLFGPEWNDQEPGSEEGVD